MADEIPISEVLCDAVDYLSKLGLNLRTRSENLKQKRINKKCLKNTHAVVKAANKLLLISELSKKSLENVENGVKQILLSVSSLTNDGAKLPPPHSQDNKNKNFRVIEFDTFRLKVPKNVPFKHFTSVKVRARNMSVKLQDKYPVFYDCKLFRLRNKREISKTKFKRVKGVTKEKLSEVVSDGEVSSDTVKENDTNDIANNLSISNSCGILGKSSENLNKSADLIKGTLDKSYSGNEKNSDSNLETEKRKNLLENFKEKDVDLKRKTKKQHRSNSSEDSKKHSTDTANLKETVCSPSKRSEVDLHKNKSETSNDTKEPSKIIQKAKRSRIIEIDDDSSNDEGKRAKSDEKYDKTEVNVSINTDKLTDAAQKSDCNYIDNDNTTEESTKNLDKPKEKENPVQNKPLIKCVSITKLLKPDILNKDIVIQSREKAEYKTYKRRHNRNSTDAEVKEYKEREENFWKQKRKDVSDFKAKNFNIHVKRLPHITEQYLFDNNLKQITKNGVVIARLAHVQNQDITAIQSQGNKMSEKIAKQGNVEIVGNMSDLNKDKSDINQVKSALLNDSDSDDKMSSKNKKEQESQDVGEIKNALLFESDSNAEEDKENPKSDSGKDPEDSSAISKPNSDNEKGTIETNKPQNLIEKKNSEKIAKQGNVEIVGNTSDLNKDKSNINQVKCALLNDSDSDDKKSSTNQKEQESQDVDEIKDALLFESDSNAEEDKENPKSVSLNVPEVSSAISKPNSDNENGTTETNNPQKFIEKSKTGSDDQILDSRNPEPKTNLYQEIIKSSLLNDSSDENSLHITNIKKIHKKKTKQRKSDSQRKFTSSSSDSDEDNLKRSVREAANALLRRDSSSENEQNQQPCEKSHSALCSDSNSENIHLKYSSCKEKDSYLSKEKISDDRVPLASSSDHSSDSRDASDKEINGLTNLRKLSRTRQRYRSTSWEKTKKTKRKKSKMPKVQPLGEQLLEAESNSDAVSEAESDTVEDLPVVSMKPLNGGTDHLAKDDLLGDSDTSDDAQDDTQANTNQEDDSESGDNVKSKRRKANTISSDSEGGSSRKKNLDPDVKVSDFEDSGEESEPIKKSKRKKQSDSDASGSSVEGKKKRRRIKQLKDSDGSGSDTENEGKNKHGRKNIRRVMGKNQLEEATKKAAREEKERIARIAERQKTYNNLAFDESGKPDEVVLDKVVLDFDPETKEPIIEVDRGLVKKLKPHQANGIKFMWDACFESVKRIKKDRGSGCILAHCMGLGKTLQVVSLTHTLLTHEDLTGVNRVLVVCPLSTVLNWVNEFRMWLKYAQKDYELDVYELSRYKQNSERAYQLQQWFRGGGVCVLGYEMFRNLSADNGKKFKKKMLKTFQESLVDPGPDLVVCDEGHLLKNEKTSLSQSMNRVKTLRRIVLTGTPLQNNLKEYYCMVQFVKPNLLGKYNEYLNRFVNPITNGQYTDSTEHDIRIMKRRSHVLHTMLDGAVQRRDYGVLAPFLPPKHEYVLFITLTDIQVKLYQHYLDNYSRRPLPGKSSGFLFPDFQSLQRIWTHPLVLKYNSERYEIMQQKKREREEEEDSEGSLVDFIDDDDSTPDESSTDESQDDMSDLSDDSTKKNKKKKSKKSKAKEGRASGRRGTRANPVEIGDDEEKVNSDVEEVKSENPTEWWVKLVEEEELDDLRNSHKLVLLFDILKQCEIIGDKLLVFSQSLYSLDLIEHFLGKVDEATQEGRIDEKLGGHIGTWSPGIDYFRLDGSTSCENRSIWCKNFNREDNPRARLFLISTRAGGLGINLVAANRVVIFDVSWNPSHDVQSIFRVYRFGQKKPCYVYRFLAMGTMEEKIYERQVTKQAISKRVIDEQQIDRHYKENDLAELYKFEPRPPEPRPLPALPKDRLFAEMLMEHDQQIYKFHEHDSLLENKEEETLTQEERKAAWEDFENEKNRPPPVPFTAATWGHNGLTAGMLAQQQQQLAYAALASMLRKDMPNINENQIRDMLPLIYNSNPGLMQKISDIYKYAQPGMMNPMMNPVMNAAGVGGAGALGGSSGLQYEPPWQRQQQQQQQLRLQQLMQHQNQMNAKFYAGGLGSRDPVAMALQQQRAREMMLGERGRARGRPPLQPRAPPTAAGLAAPPGGLAAPPRASGDVVNLADSD